MQYIFQLNCRQAVRAAEEHLMHAQSDLFRKRKPEVAQNSYSEMSIKPLGGVLTPHLAITTR
jgi:hypothetical protein